MSRRSFFHSRESYHHGSLKEALVEAALALIAERGAAGFTIAEAAKRVGVTGAAPYRHFTDRNDLMGELARRGFELFALRLDEAFDGGRPDAFGALERMGAAYLGFARTEPGLYAAMFANVATLDTPGPAAAADRALDVLRKAAAAVLRATGTLRADARPLALRIWAVSHGVATLTLSGHLTDGPDTDPQAVLRETVQALIVDAARTAR